MRKNPISKLKEPKVKTHTPSFNPINQEYWPYTELYKNTIGECIITGR